MNPVASSVGSLLSILVGDGHIIELLRGEVLLLSEGRQSSLINIVIQILDCIFYSYLCDPNLYMKIIVSQANKNHPFKIETHSDKCSTISSKWFCDWMILDLLLLLSVCAK